MCDEQKVTVIPDCLLVENALKYKDLDYRLVQICANRIKDGYELTYSFAKEYDMENIRVIIDTDEEIYSISAIFPAAFLYENEMKDLFGVKIVFITLDYNGNFYKMSEKQPFKNSNQGE
ncbi:MAG: NADH-quinone oxidoreductase subunit C [Oscillospiraceae bacterium]